MHRLIDGDILYHASYAEIKKIDLDKCSLRKDFGHGFYLTTDFEQAKNFVKSGVYRAISESIIPSDRNYGYVNVYRLISANGINEYDFEAADRGWLHYVAGNRSPGFFRDEIAALESYNVIGGKIANDRTATTLNLYIGYGYGIPGEDDADNFCIRALLPNRLKNQYCFKEETAVKQLEFVKSIRVELDI